jgi:hypothetical protein
MKAVALLNAGNNWTDVTTRIAFPIVLRRAMDGRPITYGELNSAVAARGGKPAMALTYRYTAGKIGDICAALADDTGMEVPPINAIIINEKKGLPSHGVDYYLARFLHKPKSYIKQLSASARNAYAQQTMQRVYDYADWLAVAAHLGLKPSPRKTASQGIKLPPPNPNKFSYGPESQAHKALKKWVSSRPKLFAKFGKFGVAANEYLLSSGDRLDAFFSSADNQLAVEVKTADANDAEVQRGVFQCIKYRATLRAMQLANMDAPNAQAVLVLEHSPSDTVAALAKRLSVDIIVVNMKED